MDDLIWRGFVILLEFNVLLLFLGGLVFVVQRIGDSSKWGFSYSKFLRFFYILISLTLVLPFLKIEKLANPLFPTLVSKVVVAPQQEIQSATLKNERQYQILRRTNENDLKAPLIKNEVVPISFLEETGNLTKQWLKDHFDRAMLLISLSGFLIFLIRYLKTRFRFKRLLKDSFLIKQFNNIRILASDQISGPFSIRMLGKKYIFVPNYIISDKDSFSISIKHEIQHHRQWDTFFVYVIEAIRCSFFYNPFAWVLISQVSKIQELACDETLIGRKRVSSFNYSSCLLKVADYQSKSNQHKAVYGLVGMARLSPSAFFLKRRLLAMKTTKHFSKLKNYLLSVVIFILFISVGYAAKDLTSNSSIGEKNQEQQLLVEEVDKRNQKMFSIEPVKGSITTRFGGPWRNPFTHKKDFHSGIDFEARTGTSIVATASGTIRKAQRNGGYGLFVEIQHEKGYKTRYGHMSEIKVKVGQNVEEGEVIGLVGSTGKAVGPHLHYEIIHNDKPVDPLKFIKKYSQNQKQKTSKQAAFFTAPAQGRITDRFGPRIHPVTKKKDFHNAIDISARRGTPIVATASGTILKAKRYGNYGLFIEIQHENGFRTRYAQMSEIKVKKGQKVKEGEVIGLVGSSGISTGPHLHYEIIDNGKNVDPLKYTKPPHDFIYPSLRSWRSSQAS